MVSLISPATPADLPIIEQLARKIWPVCYESMISKASIDYMLDLFYNQDALQEQMNILNHQFLIIREQNIPIGFASYELDHKIPRQAKLHKLYVQPETHKSGYGKQLVQSIIDTSRQSGQEQLILHVNRGNPAIGFYENLGFRIVREDDIDIGNGFWMNDYLMQKMLS